MMSSSSSKKKKRSSKNSHTHPPVFTIHSDDEEGMLREALRRSVADMMTTTSTKSSSSSSAHKRHKSSSSSATAAASAAPVCISLLSDDDDDDDEGMGSGGGAVAAMPGDDDDVDDRKPAAVSVSPPADDDVEVVAPAAPALEPALGTTTSSSARNKRGRADDDDDDEIDVLGATNVTRLPHMRQHCTECRFVPDVGQSCVLARRASDLTANETCCSLCYCYVCDVPASSCAKWKSASDPTTTHWSSLPHCLASDAGRDGYKWKNLRQAMKRRRDRGGGGGADASSSTAAAAGRGGGGPSGSTYRSAGHPRARVGSSPSMRSNALARPRAALASSPSPSPSPRRRSPSMGVTPTGRSDVQRLLEAMYGGSGASVLTSAVMASSSSSSAGTSCGVRSMVGPSFTGSGPFHPDHREARTSSMVTQCRRCKWYNRFNHADFTAKDKVYDNERSRSIHGKYKYVTKLNPISSQDWCHRCGRVASDRDLCKEQAKNYRGGPGAGCVSLGTRTIPFRIVSHDPRNFDEYRATWQAESGWSYNPYEMDEDTFLHRLGPRPQLKHILSMIPIVAEEQIPKTGVLKSDCSKHQTNQRDYCRGVSASETEALLLETQHHQALFEELSYFGISHSEKQDTFPYARCDNNVLGGDIKASWDKNRRKGTFTVNIYVKRGAFIDNHNHWWSNDIGTTLSRLFGVWFNVLPLPIHELTTMAARLSTDEYRKKLVNRRVSFPPYDFKSSEAKTRLANISTEEKSAILEYNTACRRRMMSTLSFVSSSESSSGGGTCNNDVSFEGTIRRYFSETLAEDAERMHNAYDICMNGQRLSWSVRLSGGAVAHHRDVCRPSSSPGVLARRGESFSGFRSYVRDKDHALLVGNLRNGTHSVFKRTQTFKGLMQQLENLGHTPAPQVEGLNVELLNYQRQAVGWAIERENKGIQSFLWTKLPIATGNNSSDILYFSPVLDVVSRTPPKKVRGGMICEEMGLGKTVISLSIVLQNPAPSVPESGALVASNSTRSGWSSTIEKPNGAADAWGSVYSRGTLVICNVSLVGQWVDEAKSKLKNPGMVYSYYDGKRNKNAKTLAENDIVVTTYQTLASDANYHKKKSNSDDYCPPCEQVRWWRVICDESHCLRNANTEISKSVSRLAAENRWCVTGTPMNTDIKDLKNQLKFIGMEHIEAFFRTFSPLWTSHTTLGTKEKRSFTKSPRQDSPVGAFLFVMRNVMIRHSMKMKNRGTMSDLMSLPAKKERTVYVSFSDDERTEYVKLEKVALESYLLIRRKKEHEFKKRFLLLLQTLMPLRVACSGGPIQEKKEKNYENAVDHAYQMTDEDETECSICLNHYQDARATNCRHVFCKECIEGVIGVMDEASGPCPICRENVKMKSLRPALLPQVAQLRQLEDTAKEGPVDFAFKSKFAALVEELKTIRDREPVAKSLVFSQFATTLTWMQKELPRHGFQFRTLSGDMTMTKRSKALRDFQKDPPTTIFLLSMRAGAVGINLTQANRVFIMEPAMNPALEAQAIGRVHRLGQTRRVEIVRLVMKNSFETRLLDVVGGHGSGAPNDTSTGGKGRKPASRGRGQSEEHYVVIFQQALNQHKLDTKQLLKDAADAGLKAVPVGKMSAARLRNREAMRAANEMLRKLGSERTISEEEVIKNLSEAETIGVDMHVKAETVRLSGQPVAGIGANGQSGNDSPSVDDFTRAFHAAFYQHQVDTRQLLKDAADSGLDTVPTDKMSQVRRKNLHAMKEANDYLRKMGSQRQVADNDLTKKLMEAENLGMQMHVKTETERRRQGNASSLPHRSTGSGHKFQPHHYSGRGSFGSEAKYQKSSMAQQNYSVHNAQLSNTSWQQSTAIELPHAKERLGGNTNCDSPNDAMGGENPSSHNKDSSENSKKAGRKIGSCEIVGSLRKDNVKLRKEEFDVLYGYSDCA